MGKFKTSYGEMASHVRTTQGTLRVLKQADEYLFDVEVWLLSNTVNRNNWKYENLEKHVSLFANTPILTAYVGGKVGDGHNFRMKRDPVTGEEVATFMDATAERIVGWFPSADSIRLENKDGVDWIVGKARIWTYYNRELVDLLTVQGGEGMSISIETLVDNPRMDGDVEVFDSYKILGTTILGKGVRPAVEGAYIYKLNDVEGRLNEFKLRVASYNNQQKAEPEKGGKPKKGVNPPMSKKKIAEMQGRFPKHRVMSVSDDNLTVLLLSKEGRGFCKYTFDQNDGNVVIDNKFTDVSARVNADMGEGMCMELEADEVMETLENTIGEQTNRANSAEAELEKANAAIADMVNRENRRRIAAAKEAVKRELEDINGNRGENDKIEDAVCAEVNARIDAGEFTELTDDKGDWCGAEKACAVLQAACMNAIKKMDKQAKIDAMNINQYNNPIVTNNSTKDQIESQLALLGVTIHKK
jgi:hypothetical protein